MYSFDASSIVDLWDNYPIQNPHFKSVWEWFDKHVINQTFVISDVAHKEVEDRILYGNIEKDIPESRVFIDILGKIKVIPKEISDLESISNYKNLLEIEEDNYHSKGVGENDLLIIAIAKRVNSTLVTNEGRQQKLPNKKGKYKIPAVCSLEEVKQENLNLNDLLHLKTLW